MLLVPPLVLALSGGCGDTSGEPSGTAGSGGSGAGGTGGSGGSGGSPVPAGPLPQLHVDGNKVEDPSGNTIVLRGVALPDIGMLYFYGGQGIAGITNRIDKVLAAGLDAHILRFPIYPRSVPNSGYPTYSSLPFPIGPAAPSTVTQMAISQDDYVSKVLQPAVDYATMKGMYVIVDYHQIDDATGQSGTDATTFWQYMAPKFAGAPNVIYEAFNEPINTSLSWASFKPTAQGFIDTIRAGAPDNLIIVPSMTWDQKTGDAASSPLTGTNLLYSAHVYPGNWKSAFMQQVATAVPLVPVIFSEWGYVLNSTDMTLGTSDSTWGTTFETLVDGYGASWTAWVADDSWTPNMFAAGSSLTTLTPFGMQVASWLQAKASSNWVQ